MSVSKWQVAQAAQDIRTAEVGLTRIVQELQDAGVWSGADADRFQREWNDLVRGRLLSAAAKLDAVSFITI
ncbi:hypothetical protein [Salinibacterium sp. ZJ450]|uniref:hypothetical protein n=1 Tax=Salinibacterium sp. ZJ450 TaxID=2708338 RepID=UPI001423B376|nr:hypothetical protein [Salinibacterium sp. ZJ450]